MNDLVKEKEKVKKRKENVTSKDHSSKFMLTFKGAMSVAAFAITPICATADNAADNIADAASPLPKFIVKNSRAG